jgi:hypothetical protein
VTAILAALGVPLWPCALGILAMVLQNRKLRKRHGNLPVHHVLVADERALEARASCWVGLPT